MEFESKLIPVLREGVVVVKMILYKELKPYLAEKYPDRDSSDIGMLTGAVINDLFGTPNTETRFMQFVDENRTVVDREITCIATRFEALRLPLTDALRVQFLCDSQEGIGNEGILTRAREVGILRMDRDVPLPKFFMNLVRRLGVAYRILSPQADLASLENS